MTDAPKINDGGPAFPTHDNVHDPRTDGFLSVRGMTLRDWFAGQVIGDILVDAQKDLLGWKADTKREGIPLELGFARTAYCIADAMIDARKGGAE